LGFNQAERWAGEGGPETEPEPGFSERIITDAEFANCVLKKI
jgi:hypothetical protein